MKLKTGKMCLLFDLYGNILTGKQKELFDLYYNEDWSLAEISENKGITRQAVRDCVARSEDILLETEDKLGFSQKYEKILDTLRVISERVLHIKMLNQMQYKNEELEKLSGEILNDITQISE